MAVENAIKNAIFLEHCGPGMAGTGALDTKATPFSSFLPPVMSFVELTCQPWANIPKTFHLSQSKIQSSYHKLEIPHDLVSLCFSCYTLPCSPYFSHTGLLACMCLEHAVISSFRVFAIAVPSAQKALLSQTCLAHSLASFKLLFEYFFNKKEA